GGNLVDLALEGLVVDRVERLMQIVLKEQPEHRVRRYQVDLKPRIVGDHALFFERREIVIGNLGNIGIEEVIETYVAHTFTGPQPVAEAGCTGGVHAEQLVGFLESGITGEDWLQPSDPVRALPCFAVRNARQTPSQNAAHSREHVARVTK